jgi:uncharacterized iron-regulated membrane protein
MFDAHLYVGLGLGLLFLVTGLTGSLIVFRAESETALHASWMESPRQTAPIISPQAALDAARRAFPAAAVRDIGPPTEGRNSFEVVVRPAPERDLHVYLNPYTGETLGAWRRKDSVLHWLTEAHVALLAGKTGEIIVGAAGVLLAVVCLSGFGVWLPKRGQRFANGFSVKWNAGWKRVNYDLHKAGGFAALALLTLIAATGAGLAFPQPTERLILALTQSPERPPRPKVISAAATLSLDEIAGRAETALPGGVLTRIQLPRAAGDPVVVRKRLPGEWRAGGHSAAFLNPATGEVLRAEDARNAPLGRRAIWAIYSLHVGEYAGLLGRVMHVVIGLTPGALFISGFLMWRNRVWLKWRRNARKPASATKAVEPYAVSSALPDVSERPAALAARSGDV